MKTIYILITALFLSTASSFAQIEGIFGDIIEEVQEKVGDAQQDAADTASMKEFKNEIKEILAGINGLDKYSSELKCIYLIIKLASLDQDLEVRAQNAALCKEQYDLYGMQLMVKASYTGIGYCYDSIIELLEENSERHRTPEFKQLLNEYEAVSNIVLSCLSGGIAQENLGDCIEFKGKSKLEIDFIITLGSAITTFDSFQEGMNDPYYNTSREVRDYIHTLLGFLFGHYNPVAALAQSIEIGANMSALPCK